MLGFRDWATDILPRPAAAGAGLTLHRARVAGIPHRRREQMGKGDRGDGELGREPEYEEGGQEAPDPEPDHRRGPTGEHADGEDGDQINSLIHGYLGTLK